MTVNAAGDFTYDPNGAFEYLDSGQRATDTFTYQIDDGNGGTETATVTVTITGVNDAPTVAINTGIDGAGRIDGQRDYIGDAERRRCR